MLFSFEPPEDAFLCIYTSYPAKGFPEAITGTGILSSLRNGKTLLVRGRRPVLALDRLLFRGREGKVGYRHSQNGAELETMDYLEFIARVTSHIPDKGQVMVRYYGLYANAHRGKVRKVSRVPVALGMIEEEPRPIPSKGWAEGTIPAIRADNPAQELRQAGS